MVLNKKNMFSRKIIPYLKKWKNKTNRKPLILEGARQVGKTSAVLMFGEKHFKNVININLEKLEYKTLFQNEMSLNDVIKTIEIKFNQEIIPGETLIFFDEIQNSPTLIKQIRFFKEEKPKIHVIATGSLLGPMLKKYGFSFPVGRVEYAYMYPLDFFEFLKANNNKEILKYLKEISFNETIPDGIHKQAMDLFYKYTMIGGMPEIVQLFIQGKNKELKNAYSSLFTAYSEDAHKYSSLEKSIYINHVINKAPFSVGNTITYNRFGDSNFGSKNMKYAFSALEKAMLLHQIPTTQSKALPLKPKTRPKSKLFFLDVGLVNYQRGIQENNLEIKDLNHFHRGEIAEQVVAQNIISQFINQPYKIMYWRKPPQKGEAEIDFCLNKNGKILGIEVKSGKTGHLKSLYQFSNAVKNNQIIRIYSGELKKETKTKQNKSLLSIPFYLTPRILD